MTGCCERQLLREIRADAVQSACEVRAREVGSGLRQDAGAETDCGRVFANRASHSNQNAVNLGLLFIEEPNQLVVLLDGVKRFNKYSLSGRRRTVNDAGYSPFELSFDLNDESFAADSDEIILGAAAFAQAAEGFAQALLDRMVVAFDRSANAAAFGRRFIVQASVRFDLAAQKTQERSEVVVKKGPGQVHDTGPVIAGGVSRRVDDAAPRSDAFDDCEQIPDLSGF